MSSDSKITKTLQAQQKGRKHSFGLLLLGAGESGKTTVLKQLVLIHGEGFDDSERQEAKNSIYLNLLDGAYSVIKAGRSFGTFVEEGDIAKAAQIVSETHSSWDFDKNTMEDSTVKALKDLNSDPSFIETKKRRSEFHLSESWDMLMKRLQKYPEWGGKTWIPDDDDVLLTRVKTTGIVQKNVHINSNEFRITDVGGQRSERKKWFRLFNGIDSLLFIAALNEYNQVLEEDTETNRLVESLDLWKQMSNRKEFADACLILFLNKFDLFKIKYFDEQVPIKYTGEYVNSDGGGPPPTVEVEEDDACKVALEWFAQLYKYQVQEHRKSSLFIHVTTALDKNLMKLVLTSVAANILQMNLRGLGLER